MLKILMKLAGAVMILAAIASCKEDNQDFGIANIGASTESVTFTKDGGEQTIRILSTRDWTAEITSTDGEVDWLVVSPASGAPSTDSVSVVFTAVPNSNEDRYATVTFKAGAVSATVSVSQPGEIARQYDAIADVRALYNGENVTITEDWTICGTVISNYRHAKSGGLNNATSQKTMVIQDETAGITLYLAENNTDFALGDKVEVKVKDLTLQRYQNGSLQIDAVPMDRVTKLTSGQQVEAKTISASELVTGEYESQYVAVTDVQVSDADRGKTFVEYGPADSSHRSINFIARTGERFVLFSSAYSTFGKETVPEGSGTLKGIAAVYGGGTYQISITSTDDYAGLTGERFEGSVSEGGIVGDYNTWKGVGPLASFSDDFSSISSANQQYVNDNWLFYSNAGTNINDGFKTGTYDSDKYIQVAPHNASIDEVIAFALPPRADMTKADPKTFSFRKALYHLDDGGDDSKMEVVVSTNFTGDFTSATWTVVKDVSFPEGAERNQWIEETIDLSDYASESALCIALRYTGKANTYRIDDVAFGSGENQGGGDEPDPDEPGDLKVVTIEEFLAAQPGDGVWYQLTGEMYDIYNTQYGNFWIRDDAGNQVRVYGLTSTKQESNDYSFESIGLSEGDIVTIATLRAEHNGEAQAGGTPPAYYISHEEGEEPEVPTGDPTALIISEYVEGSGNNKYLEIANISDSEIDLAAYTLRKYVNGAEDNFDDMALSGTLASKAVKVFRINTSELTLPEGVTAEATNSQVLNFNGDDPVALICNGEVVDLLGVFGDVDFGKDVTLRRKSSVTAPSATYNVDEWDTLEKNDVSGLGTL